MVTTTIPAEDSVGSISSGKDLYEYIAFGFNGSLNDIQKQASLFLLENGIDGIKYPAESISRGATSETARGFNYVVFDENAITIDERIQFLSTNDKIYGFYDENTKQIFLNESFLTSNSLIHEHWHAFKPILKDLASKGDIQAKLLLDTFKRTVDNAGVFNQAEFEARYDAQNQQKGKPVQFSILGEEGAAALDRFEEASIRLDNLAVARDMEAAGKTQNEIRTATGWEKGVDTKWRYEILDGSLKISPSTYKGVLSDVFENEELFKAYPSLKDLQVDLKLNGFGTGSYTRNKITVNGGTKDMLSILIHEIQHAIQSIEGFARGGNMTEMSQFDKEIETITSPLTFPKLSKEERAIAKEKTKSKGIRFSEVFYYDAESEDVDKLEDVIERLDILNEVSPNSTYTDLIDIVEERLSQILMGDTPIFDRYQRIAGEVEARNVQKRLEMSPEERLNTLLKDTENVSREDQIILKDSIMNIPKSVQFSILGEEGAQELDKYDESLSRLGQLELARKMKKDGQDPFSIRMATGWELNTVTDKWQYEIQPNMSIRKGVINNNNVFPGTTLEDLIDYPELFKAYPDLKNIKIKAVPYDEVNFEANYKPISNVIEISNYLLDETSRRLSPVLLHEIQHAIQVAEGYSPTSSQDIEEYVNTIQNIGLRSEYSDIQDNSEEILFETLGYFKEAYKSVEEYVYNPWSQNITNTLKFFFKNIHGVNVKTPKTIKSYSINGDRVYRMDEIARETEDSSKGIIEGLNKEIAILFERNSVSSEKDLNQQLNTEKDEERLDDLNSTKRVLNNIKNRISEVENGNFKVETTEDSPELELQDLLEAYNNQNNTSLTQDDVINDITSYVENNRKDEDDIYYRSQSEVEARNIEERMNLSPEDRRMFVLSSTEDVDRADQLNISNGILGDMYSKIPNAYQNIWDEMYVNTYEDVLSKGLPISTIKVLIDQEARNKGVSVDEPILSKGIDKDAELIPVSELESFVGEFRAGKDKMVNSSETINKLKEDISKNGFKESIIVQYTKDGEASIVEGNHRFQAAKELGLSKIPVTFKRVDKLPNNVSSDFLNVSIKDNFSKTGADLGFTSYKITPYDYKGSSRLSTRLTSEVYNPRPGESKENYIERMREEIEANLLGENSEAYFERIATENNLTEEAKKSFKEKLKKFVKIFSDWLARQLGFNNITPAEAAKLTTTDVLDRVTTSMLRGDFRPEELVKNKLKNAKAKASELQASKDSGLEIITPVDLQNIEECT
jgi:hypothetical protein